MRLASAPSPAPATASKVERLQFHQITRRREGTGGAPENVWGQPLRGFIAGGKLCHDPDDGRLGSRRPYLLQQFHSDDNGLRDD